MDVTNGVVVVTRGRVRPLAAQIGHGDARAGRLLARTEQVRLHTTLMRKYEITAG